MTESTPPAATEPQASPTPEPTSPTTEPPAPSLLTEPAPVAPAPYTPLAETEIAELFGTNAPQGEALKKVATTFTELQLSKDGAAKLSTLYNSMRQEAEQATANVWNETIKGWQDQAKAHPDFGGAKFDASLAQAKQIVNDYGDQTFKEMLALTGVGNHPAMISFILKMAKALPGEAAPASTQVSAAPADLASRLFPQKGA